MGLPEKKFFNGMLVKSALTLLLAAIGILFSFQNCAPANFGTPAPEDTAINSASNVPQNSTPSTTVPPRPTSTTLPIAKSSCILEGNEIPHGNSVLAFAAKTYQCGTQPASEMRVCTNGYLSGSYPYISRPSSVGGQNCPAQTLTANITAGNGAYCVQQVPQSVPGSTAPTMNRIASHGPNCNVTPGETPYLGTAYFTNQSGMAQVCENYCGVYAVCGCDGVWKIDHGNW